MSDLNTDRCDLNKMEGVVNSDSESNFQIKFRIYQIF